MPPPLLRRQLLSWQERLLAHAVEEMRVSDIIVAVDEPIRATRCAPGSPVGCRVNKSRCLTHDLWEELGNQIHLYLSSVTLADVCQRRVLGTSGVIAHDEASGAGADADANSMAAAQ